MELFLSYRFTGEDPAELATNMGIVCGGLRRAGHQVFCSLDRENYFRRKHFDAEAMYQHCFEELTRSEAVVAFVRTRDLSTGIQREMRLAKQLNKPTGLIVQQSISDSFLQSAYGLSRSMCARAVDFDNIDDLPEPLSRFRL